MGFASYGMDVLNYTGLEHEDRPDPMAAVFPKVTKCTFHKYGPSGTVEKKDGLCVLPVNTIHGGKSCRRSDVEAILDPADQSYTEKLGDWFLLHLICKNLNVLLVNDLIRQLHKSEEGSNSNTETLKLRSDMTTNV